jgi:hypothetical protein
MTRPTSAADSGPTVALVHGAFADSAGWNDVIAQLLAEGVPAVAGSNPLRGIAHDAAYVASALGQIPGSVLTVGHSYGGAVLTNARSVQATFSDWCMWPRSPPTRARRCETSRPTARTASSTRPWYRSSTRRARVM